MKKINSVFDYYPSMDIIESDIQERIKDKWDKIKDLKITDEMVRSVLEKDKINELDFFILLSDTAQKYIEFIAEKAKKYRNQYFGNNVYLFSPLYIANYCENSCKYCGFNAKSKIRRLQLNIQEIEEEMISLKEEGIEEVLILTGESKKFSSIEYIGEAIKIAKKYFRVIGLEIYPSNIKDYSYFHECGADFITVFQETYNEKDYDYYHPSGNKRSLSYRINTQERAILGGIRGVGFGALFGLSNPIQDAFSLGYHASLIQRKYPHAEIAISLPRIRPTKGVEELQLVEVSEKQLFQIILAIRLYLPFASITMSTRERKEFRDLAMIYGATKVSASVDTGIGRRSGEMDKKEEGEEQFLINDVRTEKEMEEDIKKLGLTPVLTDYLYFK